MKKVHHAELSWDLETEDAEKVCKIFSEQHLFALTQMKNAPR